MLPASGAELFTNTITVDGQIVTEGTHDIRQVAYLYGDQSLADLFPGYTDDMLVLGNLDMRGIDVLFRFAENSDDLEISIPVLGQSMVIPGQFSRDVTIQILRAFLRGEIEIPDDGGSGGTTSITPILRALLLHSPVDPIAGNPNSLESKMFAADYNLTTVGPFLRRQPDGSPRSLENRFRVEGDFSYFQGGPYSGQSYDLAGGYTWNLSNPKISLLFDLPLAITQSERGTSYMGSVAVGLQYRIKSWWNVSPVFRTGLSGSFELGGLALILSGSITSNMRWEMGGFQLGMGNMVGVAGNVNRVKYGNIQIAYELLTTVLQNGIDIGRTLPIELAGRSVSARAFYRITNYLGTDLYLNNQHDVGLAFGIGAMPEPVSFEISWVGGREYDSLRLRLTGRF
jgi:hypothetical protein